MRAACLAIACLAPACSVFAGGNSLLAEGFDHFYNLEYEESVAAFKRLIAAEPENPQAYNHLAQAVLYREMLRSGALESQLVTGNNPFLRREKMNPSAEEQQLFDGSIAKAIELANALLAKNPRGVAALYSLGVSFGLRANYLFLVRKAWMDALRDSTTARKYHMRVTEIDPSDVDAMLVQGLHDYVVGSLPWTMKVLGFLAGFHGDRDRGIRILQRVAEQGVTDRVDAEILLAAIYRRERQPLKAIPLLDTLLASYPRAYLFRFELAQMYGDAGDKAHALTAIDKIEDLKAQGAAGYTRVPEEKIRYARGNLLFWYNDVDAAIENLKYAAGRASDLDLSTGVMAWMRLGQCYDMRKERKQAVEAYRQAIAYAPKSEAAHECGQYLSSPYRR